MGRIQTVAQGEILGVRRGSNRKAYFAQTASGRAPQLRSVTAALNVINKADVLIPWALRLQAKCLRKNAPVGQVLTPDMVESWLDDGAMEFERVRWKAADIGTHVHKLIELWLTCDPNGPTEESLRQEAPEVQNCMRLFFDWWKGKGLRVVDTEQIVFNGPHGYAGTLDFVCELPNGKLALIDFKSSRGVYSEMYLQLAAYYYALLAMGCQPDEFAEVTILRIGKEDAHFEAVEVPMEILPIAYKTFYCCLKVLDGLANVDSIEKKRWRAAQEHLKSLKQEVKVPF